MIERYTLQTLPREIDPACLRQEVERMIGVIPYLEDGRDPRLGVDCEGWIRYLLSLRGIACAEDIYTARNDFVPVEKPQAWDIAVLREAMVERRHLIMFLDRRWFTHCSAGAGVSISDIGRGAAASIVLIVRHHSLSDAQGIPAEFAAL